MSKKISLKYIGKNCVSFEHNNIYEIVSEILFMGKKYYIVIDESGESYPYKPEFFEIIEDEETAKAV